MSKKNGDSSENFTHSVGEGIETKSARWTFSGDVAKSFDSHVSKSVPLYESGHELTVKLSDFFVKSDSVVYEIGTSTGSLLRKIANRHSDYKDARFIGLDVEPKMINHAKTIHASVENMFFNVCRVEDFEFENSDFITSHYTIQFIPPKNRQRLFDKIYESLDWGGAFVLFEKVRASDARFQDIITTLYNEYKIDKGYSYDEILSKSLSLKGVMEPFSSSENIEFMRRSGFKDFMSIQKYLCFEGWLAIK